MKPLYEPRGKAKEYGDYAVNILQADELMIRRGYDIFRELLGIYHECKITDNWYGFLGPYNVINSLSLPAWLAKEVG